MQRLPPVLHGEAAPRRLRRPRRAVPAPLRRPKGQEVALDPTRRAALLAAKLQALVETTAGPADRRSLAFPGGAALTGDDGTWVLADAEPRKVLGPAVALALRHRPDGPIHVVVESDAALLARRASQFAQPPTVWHHVDGTLVAAEPEPLPAEPPVDPRLLDYAPLLARHGCDPVVEHGRLVGEVNGLEVARVSIVDGEPRLEVGVGRFDREANDELAGGAPGEDALDRAVQTVRRHRTLDGDTHPLKLLATARWLRSRVVEAPSLVGAAHLTPMAAIEEPPDLRTPWPAPASGVDTEGRPLVVVCSVGIDLDLVPAAADARLADGRGARLVLAVPARDVHPVTVALAGMLAEPATVTAVA